MQGFLLSQLQICSNAQRKLTAGFESGYHLKDGACALESLIGQQQELQGKPRRPWWTCPCPHRCGEGGG